MEIKDYKDLIKLTNQKTGEIKLFISRLKAMEFISIEEKGLWRN